MDAEGWYHDPFGIHADRWFSAGKPTGLVRDDGVESHDTPPDAEMTEPLIPIEDPEPEDGLDLVRADGEHTSSDFRQAALGVFDQKRPGW